MFLQLFLKFPQDLALAETLADASDSADVLGVLLSGDEVELVLLFALGLQVLLVFEGLEDVFEVDLGRRRWLRAWRLVPECFHLLEVLIELVISLINVGLLYWGFVA